MPSKNVHVVPAKDGWAIEIDGKAERTVFPSQVTAIAAGWERAKSDQVELILHDHNGEIWARDIFDNALGDSKR